MRKPLLAVVVLLAAAAPAASACELLTNCAEVHVARSGTQSTLDAQCVVAGRAGVRFTVTGVATSTTSNATISLRCTAYAGTAEVFEGSTSSAAPVATVSGSFYSGPNVRVCVNATDGTYTVSTCSSVFRPV